MAIVKGVAQFIEYNTGDTLPVVGLAPNSYAINVDTGEESLWDGSAWQSKNKPKTYSTGFWDYNDLATQTVPFSITGGIGFVNLPNDGAGGNSLSAFKPDGLTDIWRAGEGALDFSGLSIGDEIGIRFVVNVTTIVNNTDIAVKIRLGGASTYDIPLITEQDIKTAGTKQVSEYMRFYIGNSDTLGNKGYIQMSASQNVDVVVEGWYISVLRRQ